MSFILRTIDFTATGREIVREKPIEASELAIGRATTNAIVLADLSVEQHHATLIADPSGKRLTMTAAGNRGFLYEGRETTEIAFDPTSGGEFVFGTYRLQFAPADGEASEGKIAITVSREEKGAGARDAVRDFALSSVLPGKRVMAWGLLLVVLLAFLAAPIWSHLNRADAEPGSTSPQGVAMDAAWSPGPLSKAHHALEQNCEACHVEAFVSVRDDTCLSCHTDVADHAAHPRLAKARAPMSGFTAFRWKVAETFGKEGPEACTTCHTEHEGAGAMEPASQAFCADCHGTLKSRLPDNKLGNAGDFGRSHPQFQALVFTRLGSSQTERVSLATKPKEASGLKFDHDGHLSRTNGVARMALSLSQYGAPLECRDCHVPAPDGVGFQPIVMEENCESCHSLVYDKVGDTFRTLRHGDVAQMRADLVAMDRAPRRPMLSGRRRAGESGVSMPNFGPPVRDYTSIARALSPEGVCGECHYPASTPSGPSVMPVHLQSRYMVGGKFDHEDHKQEKCASCHDASTSGSARDVLLPGIATCRTCHLGEDAKEAKVPSGCVMCHSYHVPSGTPPPDHPGSPKRQIAGISRRGG